MDFMAVDKAKCVKCGACLAECPVQIISYDDQGLPAVSQQSRALCIGCGHCLAVCPQGALSLAASPIEESPLLPPGWQLSISQVEGLLKGRRSIRSFADKPVEEAALEKLIDIARYAPSGLNRQPVRWKLVLGRDKVRELAAAMSDWNRALIKENPQFAAAFKMDLLVRAWDEGKDRYLRSAPAVVIAYALKDDPTAPQSCTIAMTHLELAAVSAGLGACWAGYLQMALNTSEAVRQVINFSSKAGCYAALMIGYPKYGYHRIPVRNKASVK